MRIFTIIVLVLGLSLTACGRSNNTPSNTNAWKLMQPESHLTFISVKKGTIIETHSFGELSGTVDKDGNAVVSIALDSVETNIDIRNERMRTHLFETEKTPNAILTTNLDMVQFASMAIGERKEINQVIVVKMRGKTENMSTDMLVTRLGANKVVVDSRTPVLLEVDMFSMEAGVGKLRDLAKLPSITPVIPVSYSLVFER